MSSSKQPVVSKKTSEALSKLLSRQDYLVVQANDLARSFGHLTSFQHRLLDFCFSFVKKDSEPADEYETSMLDIIHHFGLNASGQNYRRVAEAFQALNERTALYLRLERPNGEYGIRMTQLFSHIDLWESGKAKFVFSAEAAPYIYNLRTNFYSFKLSELANIKSKYALIMLKLMEANRMGKQKDVSISGTVEEWELWFLGKNGKDKLWPTNRFNRDVLKVAMNELSDKLDVWFEVTKRKNGRKIVGYEVDVHSGEKRIG